MCFCHLCNGATSPEGTHKHETQHRGKGPGPGTGLCPRGEMGVWGAGGVGELQYGVIICWFLLIHSVLNLPVTFGLFIDFTESNKDRKKRFKKNRRYICEVAVILSSV